MLEYARAWVSRLDSFCSRPKDAMSFVSKTVLATTAPADTAGFPSTLASKVPAVKHAGSRMLDEKAKAQRLMSTIDDLFAE